LASTIVGTKRKPRASARSPSLEPVDYFFASLCFVCARHHLHNFFNSDKRSSGSPICNFTLGFAGSITFSCTAPC
jgi:hypothetical protein